MIGKRKIKGDRDKISAARHKQCTYISREQLS